jgi:prepilin-type N-terminal cleavage/methylation domain-containing protein
MGTRRILSGRLAAPATRRVARSATRAGMTLIEVMVALVILAGSLMAMGNFMGKYSHTTKLAELRAHALDLVTDRIDSVRHASIYANVPASFAGVQSISLDSSTYTRTTLVNHVGGGVGDSLDVMVVTVKVTPPDSAGTVSKTIAFGPF